MPSYNAQQEARLSRIGGQFGSNRAAVLEAEARRARYAARGPRGLQGYINAYADGLMSFQDLPPEAQKIVIARGL